MRFCCRCFGQSPKVDEEPVQLKTDQSFEKSPPKHAAFSADYRFRIPESVFDQGELEELYAGDNQMMSCLASAIEKPSQASSCDCEPWAPELATPPIKGNSRRQELWTQLQLRKIEHNFHLSQ